MAFVQSMKVFVVAPKEFKGSLDILWNGFDETDFNHMEMWATIEEARAEVDGLKQTGQEPQIYEVQLSVLSAIE